MNLSDARSIVFKQSLEDVHGTHGGIVIALALVARSCGFDVRYSELYEPDKAVVAENEDGAWEIDKRSAEEKWRENDYRRRRHARVYVCGATSAVPLLNRHKIPAKEREIDGEK